MCNIGSSTFKADPDAERLRPRESCGTGRIAMHMFCYQCQETSMERGCLYFGACGKTEETANLQDLLLHIARGISYWAEGGLAEGKADREAGLFICKALFSTVTNTNFDPLRFIDLIREGIPFC